MEGLEPLRKLLDDPAHRLHVWSWVFGELLERRAAEAVNARVTYVNEVRHPRLDHEAPNAQT
jgi:hypothetical protein